MQCSRLLRGAAVAASLAAGCVFVSNTASAQTGVYALGGGYGGYGGYYGGGYYGGGPLAWGASLVADTIDLGLTAAAAPLAATAWGYPAYPGAYGYPGYGYSYYGYGPGYGYYPSAYRYGAGYAAYPYYYGSPYRYGARRYAYGYRHRTMLYRHRYYRGYGYRSYGPGRFIGGPRLRSVVYTNGPRRGRYGHPMIRRHPGMVQGKMIHAKYAQQPIKHYRTHVVRQARD